MSTRPKPPATKLEAVITPEGWWEWQHVPAYPDATDGQPHTPREIVRQVRRESNDDAENAE